MDGALVAINMKKPVAVFNKFEMLFGAETAGLFLKSVP